jgi:hypothetical protein
MNYKKKLKGKRISPRDIRHRNKKTGVIAIRKMMFLAKFRCHGSAQDAGLPLDTPRRYPGYYTH